ncbi:hypothetical protein [Streptomyces sp. W1SF4]|uniref:hypothetical protein n=1 Tax=Streptomyces sp. W1SF4 TaxID=2305220 RepID=UPI000F6CC0BD|nr:hypothetical protein [Streptomyces sp. W1SF4]AZM87140.1 hypothetical protein D1J60_00275 [Streptomyces sp. W1SF4]
MVTDFAPGGGWCPGLLRLPPATEPEVLARLLTTAARTVPDGFLPSVEGEKGAAFEPMLRLPAE